MRFSNYFIALLFIALSILVWVGFNRTDDKFISVINPLELNNSLFDEGIDRENETELENPEKRLDYEYSMLSDPNTGLIPDDIHLKELAFYEGIKAKERINNFQFASASQQSVKASAFVSRGPFNIGGRTRALGIDIANEDIIIAGGVSGGVWRTSNGGQSWSRTSAVSQLPAVSALVQDKREGQRNNWYYAAGEFFGNSASANGAFYFGDGIYHSSDNGLNWQLITSTSQGNNVSLGSFGIVNEIVIDNSNSQETEMYAATLSKIIRTTDGFQTFNVVLGANNTGFGFTDVAISSTGLLIATIANNTNNGQNAQEGIYRSSDGITWVNINPPSGLSSSYSRIEIAFDPQNEDVFYALGPNFLLRHTISSGEWVTLTSNLNVSSDSGQGHNAQGGYNLIAAVHPANNNVVFAGGTNLQRSTSGFTTSSSTVNIGGYLLDNNPSSFPSYPNHHPDQHALSFYASDANKMLSGSDGGVHRTSNNLASGSTNPVSWQSLNNGYLTTQFYAIDYYPFNRGDNLLVGGMQDNGTWASTSNAADFNWVELFGGDGSFNAITYNSIYVSAQEGRISRFTLNESGTSYNFQGDISPSSDDSEFLFVNPFIYDPVFQDRIYVGAKAKLYYTNDIRTNPKQGEWLTIPLPNATNLDFVSALAASVQPEGVLYLGTRTGKVFKVLDINSSAVAIQLTANNLPTGTVSSIAVDPRNADHVFLTFSNYGIISIWESTDGGIKWNSISGNLEQNANGTGNGPSVRYLSILPSGATESIYFVGTSLGLYKTELINGDNTIWVQESPDVIGSSVVSMIKSRSIDGNVVTATHGNGVFQANYDVGISPQINYSMDIPNQTALIRGPVSFATGAGFSYQWLKNGQNLEGANAATISVTESGAYQLTVTDQLGPVATTNVINVVFDDTAPILNSIVRFNPTTEQVEATQVVFRLTFDEQVLGITTNSFELIGTANGRINSVVASNGNTTFDVEVDQIQGNGLLELKVKSNSGITDQFNNAFAGTVLTSQTYTIIDLTAPTVTIGRANPTVEETNRKQVVFSIIFSEPVVDVDASDFSLSSNSISANILGVEALSTSRYLVTVGGYSQDGIVNLDFSSGQNIKDNAGNAFTISISSEESYTINGALAPSLTIQRSIPSVEFINQSQILFLLTFSEDVVNVDLTDFELSSSSTNGTLSSLNAVSESSYTITVTGLNSNGLIDLDVIASNNIETPVGHIFTGSITLEETYTFDLTSGPQASINRFSPTDEVTNLAEVTFSVSFSSPVENVDLEDFELSSNSVGATINAITAQSTTDYLVTLIEIEEDGRVELNIKLSNDIVDLNGNKLQATLLSNQTYTILNLVTSIEDPFLNDFKIIVKENPSVGVFEISFSKELIKPFEFQVVNSLGEVLLSDQRPFYNNNDKIEIDLSSFSNGLYIFKLGFRSRLISAKLLKENK